MRDWGNRLQDRRATVFRTAELPSSGPQEAGREALIEKVDALDEGRDNKTSNISCLPAEDDFWSMNGGFESHEKMALLSEARFLHAIFFALNDAQH
jgi:hypothetical protein